MNVYRVTVNGRSKRAKKQNPPEIKRRIIQTMILNKERNAFCRLKMNEEDDTRFSTEIGTLTDNSMLRG
jgi:hypothetical protein